MIFGLYVTSPGWVTSSSGPLPAAVGCGLLLVIVSLRLGPGPGRDSADFLKASLEVQCICGPAGEGHGLPFARPFKVSGQSLPEVVGRWAFAPGLPDSDPSPLLLGRSWPAQRIGPWARSVEAVLLVRVGQRRLTH